MDPLICSKCGCKIKIVGFVTHQAEIKRILTGIGWPFKFHEFDPPDDILNRDISQLIPETEDGFSPCEVQMHHCTGPDPPFRESYVDSPHWDEFIDPPHSEDNTDIFKFDLIDPPHPDD